MTDALEALIKDLDDNSTPTPCYLCGFTVTQEVDAPPECAPESTGYFIPGDICVTLINRAYHHFPSLEYMLYEDAHKPSDHFKLLQRSKRQTLKIESGHSIEVLHCVFGGSRFYDFDALLKKHNIDFDEIFKPNPCDKKLLPHVVYRYLTKMPEPVGSPPVPCIVDPVSGVEKDASEITSEDWQCINSPPPAKSYSIQEHLQAMKMGDAKTNERKLIDGHVNRKVLPLAAWSYELEVDECDEKRDAPYFALLIYELFIHDLHASARQAVANNLIETKRMPNEGEDVCHPPDWETRAWNTPIPAWGGEPEEPYKSGILERDRTLYWTLRCRPKQTPQCEVILTAWWQWPLGDYAQLINRPTGQAYRTDANRKKRTAFACANAYARWASLPLLPIAKTAKETQS